MSAEPMPAPGPDFTLADILVAHLPKPTAGTWVTDVVEYPRHGTILGATTWHIATGVVDQPLAGRTHGWYRILTECETPISVDDRRRAIREEESRGNIAVAIGAAFAARRSFRERASLLPSHHRCPTCVEAQRERITAGAEVRRQSELKPVQPVPRGAWMHHEGQPWHLSSGRTRYPYPWADWYQLVPQCSLRQCMMAWRRTPPRPVSADAIYPDTSEERPSCDLCPTCAAIADGTRKAVH